GWPESFSYTIPPGRASGYYEVVLKAVEPSTGVRIESIAFFAVRPPVGATPAGRLLLVLATNTYNAYNDFGGPSLYTGAVRTSFLRPFARGFLKKPEPHVRYPNVSDLDDPEHESFRSWADLHGLARWSGSAGWHNWERVFVAWAEREGYGVDVAVNSDLEFHPEVVGDHRLVVSVGHDEYWSSAMRDTLEHFIDHGGNVAFFSGNAVCWQVRFEDDGRTMVCYKDAYKNDPVLGTDRQHLLSTLWSSALVGRPENYLTGVSFSRGGYIRMGRAVPKASGGYTAWRPDHWAFERTGLSYGDLFGTSDATTVYEVDGCELTLSLDDGLPVPTGRDGTPADFTILATAPAQLWSSTEVPSRYRDGGPADLEATATAVFGDASPDHIARIRNNHAVMGTFSRDGTVFTAGTTDWAYGLAGRDPVVERITKNVLDRLSK
ncbi:MAG: N,N-dimethylformamidase beta subunit family domain-containing protein, partial [Acidimicrobiales bacterium]